MGNFGQTGHSWNRCWPGWLTRSSVIVMYVIAWLGAESVTLNQPMLVHLLPDWLLPSNVVLVFWIDLIATFIIFGFSVIMNNSSCYDPYWSILPTLMIWKQFNQVETVLSFRSIGLLVIITVWGVRLTVNWLRTYDTFAHQDWRYMELRDNLTNNVPHFIALPFYWIFLSLFGFHLYPTFAVWVVVIPALLAMSSPIAITIFDIVGIIISIFGVVIQAVADDQLFQFRKQVQFNRSEILKTGLFSYVRHPNYCGEMLLWLGVAIVGCSGTKNLYLLFGIFTLVILFMFYSGPAMDERLRKSRGKKFEQYAAKTPAFIPALN